MLNKKLENKMVCMPYSRFVKCMHVEGDMQKWKVVLLRAGKVWVILLLCYLIIQCYFIISLVKK